MMPDMAYPTKYRCPTFSESIVCFINIIDSEFLSIPFIVLPGKITTLNLPSGNLEIRLPVSLNKRSAAFFCLEYNLYLKKIEKIKCRGRL